MNEYDPSELIAICNSIIEDGEVSGDELYHLAQWLNEHREACFHWPGELLVKPLQDVWADGEVSKAELRKVGKLLLKIQKEAAFDTAINYVLDNAKKFDLSQPRLPAIPFTTQVRSSTDKKVKYDVELNGPSCTCPDWQKRSRLPPGHLSRCCKHILAVYGKLDLEDGWRGWLGAFTGDACPPAPHQEWMVIQSGQSWVLASTPNANGWANVFAPGYDGFERFGFNIVERRWAYEEKPKGSRTIAQAIIAATSPP